jgi:hypothetical protein
MTHGRPTMVSDYAGLKLSSVIDDEFLLQEGEGAQPINLPSEMNLFVYSTQLFDILEEVLSTFYYNRTGKFLNHGKGSDIWSREAHAKILQIDSKLVQFKATLPEVFSKEFAQRSENEPFHNNILLQSSVMRTRYFCPNCSSMFSFQTRTPIDNAIPGIFTLEYSFSGLY